eukprot:COSAG05_NODE_1114_length_5840_cov_2.676886_2_plen_77_part_00
MFLGTDQLADRLSIILTMFLTAVAFQFVLSTMLPSKSYLTMVRRTATSTSIDPHCSLTSYSDSCYLRRDFLDVLAR